jgi:membrane-associated protease RseP (regulator of RpoE activity)
MDNGYSPLYEYETDDLRPTAQEWLKHSTWFLLTFCTATLAGMIYPLGRINYPPQIPDPSGVFEWIFVIPFFFYHVFAVAFREVAADPSLLVDGLKFSVSLLAILLAHEFGHYIAARIYKVKTTLPYFIPLPVLSPAGTLGAVIKMQSPMPTQKAIFDIGVAGPLAGFAVIIPVAVLGLATMQYAPVDLAAESGGIVFADPLFTRLLGMLMGVDPTRGIINPFYAAAWIGLLVTSLNLLPASQLDGGHAVYAVLGERAHFWIGRAAFVAMVIFTVLGYQLYGTPSGLLFTILLGVLLRLPHPEPLIDEPIDGKRKLIAIITLIVFVLSFMPFPLQVTN